MNKLTIFSLIILSTLVPNVEAAEAQTPEEIRTQMREIVQEIVTEHNKIWAIEDQSDMLAAFQDFQPRVADGIDFLRGNQQYGMGGLNRLRGIEGGVERMIDRLRKSVMDIDTEMDIGDSD